MYIKQVHFEGKLSDVLSEGGFFGTSIERLIIEVYHVGFYR